VSDLIRSLIGDVKLPDLQTAHAAVNEFRETKHTRHYIDKLAMYIAIDCMQDNARDPREEGCMLEEVKHAGYPILECLKYFKASDLKRGGFTAQEFRYAEAWDAQDAKGNAIFRFEADDVFQAGFSGKEAKKAGYGLHLMHEAGYEAKQCYEAGFTVKELFDDHYSCKDLRGCGIKCKELKQIGADFGALVDAKYNCQEFKDSGITAKQLAQHGISATQFHEARFTAVDLRDCPKGTFTVHDLYTSGYGLDEVWSANLVSKNDLEEIIQFYGYAKLLELRKKDFPIYVKDLVNLEIQPPLLAKHVEANELARFLEDKLRVNDESHWEKWVTVNMPGRQFLAQDSHGDWQYCQKVGYASKEKAQVIPGAVKSDVKSYTSNEVTSRYSVIYQEPERTIYVHDYNEAVVQFNSGGKKNVTHLKELRYK
jgi:hypothetical protein